MRSRKTKSTKSSKKPLHLVDKMVLGLNIAAALCLLLCYLAPSADPKEYWFIALLGLGYFYVVIANVIFILYWIIRVKLFALISFICILIGYGSMLANYGFGKTGQPAKKQSAEFVRVMQYNVHEFLGVDKYEDEPIQGKIFEVIAEKEPDIVNIEEFRFFKKDSIALVDSMKIAMKSPYFCFKPFKMKRLEISGNAIFSKYPIIDCGVVPSTTFLNTQAIYADVKKNDKVFRVYCLHLQSVEFKRQEHMALKGQSSVRGPSNLVGKLKLAYIKRSYQVDQLKRHIEKCNTPYIITGDFNDTPISYAFNELSDGMKSTFAEKGSGFGYTYYYDFPNVQIDHILVSPDFDVINHNVLPVKLSDHYPILSDLKLK